MLRCLEMSWCLRAEAADYARMLQLRNLPHLVVVASEGGACCQAAAFFPHGQAHPLSIILSRSLIAVLCSEVPQRPHNGGR